jgi:hypothetical protein
LRYFCASADPLIFLVFSRLFSTEKRNKKQGFSWPYLSFAGLVLLLTGVNRGIMQVGTIIGQNSRLGQTKLADRIGSFYA